MNKTMKILAAITALFLAIAAMLPEVKSTVFTVVGIGREAQQLERFQANIECMNQSSITTVTNQFGIEIGTKVCKSGAVLIRGALPDGKTRLYWVTMADVFPTAPNVFSFAQAATISDESSNRYTVVCQRWIDGYHLKQRIITRYDVRDIVIHAPTGQIVSDMPSAGAECYNF